MRRNLMRQLIRARRLVRDRKGNVAIIFALSLIPIVFLTGMAMDFSSAISKRVRLNAAADAAALAAVTPTMMGQSSANAQTSAQNVFDGTAAGIPGTSNVARTIAVTNNGLNRTVTVSYTANSTNSFPNVLGIFSGKNQATWPISGSSTATARVSPWINFYLLLDNSPSMAIPATTSGITAMVNATSNSPKSGGNEGGCAFACHESNPSADNLGNPNGEDNYALAKSLNVTTRIQNTAAATQALMSTAQSTMAANNAQYEVAIYTFNGTGATTVQTLTTNLTSAASAASTIDVLEVCKNNYLTCSKSNSDTDTNFPSAMSDVNGQMPNPGDGTANNPQEVLFLVTDGVEDDNTGTCSQPLSGSRCQAPMDTTWCTTVKNRGIRIAVLYTEYLPMTSNSWYNTWIAPFQSKIESNIQSCASSGLYFKITTDSDISAAMQALFEQAVATARLTQ
jgi:Flp pilus assembly protein TadG